MRIEKEKAMYRIVNAFVVTAVLATMIASVGVIV
jgi:hypothetical protein